MSRHVQERCSGGVRAAGRHNNRALTQTMFRRWELFFILGWTLTRLTAMSRGKVK